MLKELLEEMIKIEDVLMVVKSNGATMEMKSNSLSIDGPCHMHVNVTMIKNAEFILEEKPERISYSVRFFDHDGERTLACFFTKMYDENKIIKSERKKLYDNLEKKYGKKIQF